MNKTAAVVVTYNRIELLKECIAHLQAQTAAADILVIDNASTDGTGELFSAAQEGILYFNTGANLGGAGGFNYGMRKACELGYEYVWVMDDDTLPEPAALEKLLEADEKLDGNYGWLSSLVLWKDGTECKMNRQKIKPKEFEYLHLMQYGIISAEQASFVSLLIRSETIKKLGLPIKDFFIWGDDIEFTRRLSVRNSLPCFLVGTSVVTHAMANNNGSNIATDIPERIDRYRFAFRNEAFLYRKEGLKGIIYYLAKCGKNFLMVLLKKNAKKAKRIRVLLSSMLNGLFFNPKIESIEN